MLLDEKSMSKLDEMQKARIESDSLSDDAKFQAELTSAMIQAISSAVTTILEYNESKPRKVALQNPSKSISTPDVMLIVPPLKKALEAIQSTLRGNRPDADQTNKALHDIHDVLVELPTVYPKQMAFPKKMDVKVTNPTKDAKELKNITKAIKAQKTEFKPKIEVKPTPVTVKEDSKAVVKELKSIQKELMKLDFTVPEQDDSKVLTRLNEVIAAVNSIRIPIPPPTFRTVVATNPDGTWIGGAGATTEYASKVTVDGTDTYIGEADPGTTEATAEWRARKVTTVGDETTVTWADGNNDFDNVATDLTALIYS